MKEHGIFNEGWILEDMEDRRKVSRHDSKERMTDMTGEPGLILRARGFKGRSRGWR